jgi:MFS family permease
VNPGRISRRLFAAELVTRTGDAVTLIAYPLTAITLFDASAGDLALIGAAQGLGILLVSLPAGSWVDSLPRRWPVMVAADLARAGLLAVVPLAALAGLLSMPMLVVVAFLASAVGSLFDVGMASWVPRLLAGDDLHITNARLEMARSGSAMVGPAVGGWLAAVLGPATALLADAASFVGSAGIVLSLRRLETALAGSGPVRWRSSLTDGVRFVIGQPIVRAIVATAGTNNLFRAVAMGIAILYLTDTGLGPVAIGLAFGVGHAGLLAGAVLSRPLTRRLGMGHSMQAGVALFGPSMALFALAPAALAGPAFAVMVFSHGLGIGIHNPSQVTLRQVLTPDGLRARVAAVTRIVIMGAMPLGMVLGGIIGELVGLRAAIMVSAAGLVLGSVPYLLVGIGRISALPSPVADQESAGVELAPTT